MKVKFASQICSKSLAAALQVHAAILGTNVAGTAECLNKFNDIFDSVNSSNPKLKNSLKGALSDTSPHMQFMRESMQWLSKIKIMNNNKTVTSVKCLNSWQISLSAIVQLWPILRDQYNFDFLLTRRLTHLKTFFQLFDAKAEIVSTHLLITSHKFLSSLLATSS